MTEFQELVKDAPEFALMERGELAIYAYAMYAAGAKMEAENEKLRELVTDMWFWSYCGYIDNEPEEVQMNHIDSVVDRMRKLGVVL